MFSHPATRVLGQQPVLSAQPQLDPTRAVISATQSTIRSQSSSFDESITGENSSSQHPPVNIARFSRHEPYLGNATPATSFSNPSSQEHPLEDLQDTPYKSSLLHVRDNPNSRPQPASLGEKVPSPPNASSAMLEGVINVPNKRMADGNVKYVGLSLPGSPTDVDRQGHSRDTSVTFNGSPIGELSDELRTRLSYAMVKVQNGWQSRSLEELEGLSQHGSPISAFGEIRQFTDSQPKATKQRLGRTESKNSSHHGAAASESTPKDYNTYNRAHNSAVNPLEPANVDTSPQARQAGRTYESFWREHATNSMFKHMRTQDQSLVGPSLAPPVDILPRDRRRPHSLKTPPHLSTDMKAKLSNECATNSTISNLVISPATPEKLSSARTASQNAAMEKDAVETLLFMSSPGNSGHYPSTATVGTPLRNDFALPEKRVGFAATMNGDDFSDLDLPRIRTSQISKGLFNPRGAMSEADVDRLLDQMPDEESSSEDEDNAMSQRPVKPVEH